MTTALYRRYRPENFAEVIGQDHVTAPLRQALRSGQVNHAYLFSGPRGCGKTTSARILARILNCAQNTEENPSDTPCDVCESCVELARGGPGSLDVVEIDAASHGGVDDARELRERATFAPARDRYKVFILDEAHMVSNQGFNALLKIVEEPPPHIKFIFATTEPDKVIGTIRSRTHHYPFRLVPPDVLVPYLQQLCDSEGVRVASGVLPLVVRAGGGSVRDTLSVLDQLIAGSGGSELEYEGAAALLGYTQASLLDDLVEAIAARDGASAFRVVERVISTGHEPRRFVEDLLERLRDLIVIAASGDAADAALRDVPSDQLDRMRLQARHLGASELSRSADLCNAALTEMSGATSPRLHLELLMARLLLPAVEDTRSGLGARLDRLERGLPSDGTGVRVPTAGPQAPAPAPVRAPESAPAPAVAAPAEPVVAVERVAARTPDPAPADEGIVSASEPGLSPQRPGAGAETARAEAAEAEPAPAEPAQAEPAQAEPARAEPGRTRPDVATADAPPTRVSAPAAATPPPAAARGGAVGPDTEVLRRRWPEVLETVKGLRRVTWALVDPRNAQVADLDATTLRVAFDNPALATTFRNGAHADVVARAVRETLGFDVRVEGILAEQAAAPAPVSAPAPRAADDRSNPRAVTPAEAAASWDDEPPIVEPSDDEPGEPAAPDAPPPDVAPPARGTARERGTAAARESASRTATSVPDDPSPDDPDITTSSLSGAPLVAQMLGGTVIDEQLDDGTS
ncbi:DNA polymerase III subunit gamma and tau [Cellulomonas fengjieae]|uniref:DNA polymerase III subunit gamma and tau n=1 Tax=Cellulomonas fengjieae TaxID=2819978 RepID=UPI001AAE7A26|nr:DNA polymerase III subunit gamma and tau [Cellulomonas fengjieae]MBO3102135.1 DNA polymerase III subunit gamma and tau [Cellulomonas fengjieae]